MVARSRSGVGRQEREFPDADTGSVKYLFVFGTVKANGLGVNGVVAGDAEQVRHTRRSVLVD